MSHAQRPTDADHDPSPPTVRLDVWLDVACLFKTRSEAQRACKAGKVAVNGVAAKPHRELRVGDRLVIRRASSRDQTLLVTRLEDRHIARADARALYLDETPPPTPEDIETRRLERSFRLQAPAARPDKRSRRELRRLKGQ